MIRRRVIAGVAGLALVVGVGVAPPAQQTDAYFTDTEHIAGTTFTAAVLLPPEIIDVPICRAVLLGGTMMTVRWRWPSTASPYAEFAGANTQWKVGTAEWQTVPTSGPVNGVYTATFSTQLLAGLLNTVLGQSFTAQIRSASGSFTSATTKTVTYTAGILGLGPNCASN